MQIVVGPLLSSSSSSVKIDGIVPAALGGESATDAPAGSDAAIDAKKGGDAATSEGNNAGSSLAVAMLKKQVEQLKQALVQEQQQLALASRHASRDPSAQVEVLMLTSAVNTTSSGLATASAELAAAILQGGSTSSGALLDVTA
jgi:hypothetical protein